MIYSVLVHKCVLRIQLPTPLIHSFHFTNAVVAIGSRHLTTSSSSLWGSCNLPSNSVNKHLSTIWFMVCCWSQSHVDDLVRPHLCRFARHTPWPVHGMLVLSVGHQTYELQVVGLRPPSAPLHSGLGQATYTCVPLSPSSITWYRSKGGCLATDKLWSVCGWQVKLCDPVVTHRPCRFSLAWQPAGCVDWLLWCTIGQTVGSAIERTVVFPFVFELFELPVIKAAYYYYYYY